MRSLHQSYQQLDAIIDLGSNGRGGGVDEGVEAVKSAEVVRFADFVKFTEAGKLPEAIELVEADELVEYVTLREKEVLMLGGELEVGQVGIRELLREVKRSSIGSDRLRLGSPYYCHRRTWM